MVFFDRQGEVFGMPEICLWTQALLTSSEAVFTQQWGISGKYWHTLCMLTSNNWTSHSSWVQLLQRGCRKNYFLAVSFLFIDWHTHTHPFNGPLSGTSRVSWYQKGKTYLDFTGARNSECQWHQLGHMQVCTSLQIDNHVSSPTLSFLQAGCPSCRPTNSVKAL